ncbi:O-antigen ligase family protein [Candidatus Gottesmanbacteria bacterium]|nr:O-antigen ligase family protein [Candidatus Gottesmanbacteria bacterium]
MFQELAQNLVSSLRNIRGKYILLGLIFFYLVQLFAPNKPVYFFSYFLATGFFFLDNRDIRKSLFYSFILSLFSEVGLAGSLFLMEPSKLLLGSGWWISPMTLYIFLFFLFSFGKRIQKIILTDYLIFLFFLWNVVVFLVLPDRNSFFGFISLMEQTIAYYLLRVNLSRDTLPVIITVVVSVLIFQTLLSSVQVLLRSPVGLRSEAILVENPYGLTTVEEENLFRVSGTYGHPNLFATFLLATIPFLLFSAKFSWWKIVASIFTFLALFFTYSRGAWFFSIPLMVTFGVILLRQFGHAIRLRIRFLLLFPVFVIICVFLVFPAFILRFRTISDAFVEGGSFQVRELLIQEAIRIIGAYPLTGVGLNRSLQWYANDPVTDLFTIVPISGFYRIHNTPLEIATETGIVGFILFLFILAATTFNFFSLKQDIVKIAAFLGLFGFLGISFLNPFFHASVFRIFFLLIAILAL